MLPGPWASLLLDWTWISFGSRFVAGSVAQTSSGVEPPVALPAAAATVL